MSPCGAIGVAFYPAQLWAVTPEVRDVLRTRQVRDSVLYIYNAGAAPWLLAASFARSVQRPQLKRTTSRSPFPVQQIQSCIGVRPFSVIRPVSASSFGPSVFTRSCRRWGCTDERLPLFTLRAKLSGAVYCNRSCLWRAGVVMGGRAVSEQPARA